MRRRWKNLSSTHYGDTKFRIQSRFVRSEKRVKEERREGVDDSER